MSHSSLPLVQGSREYSMQQVVEQLGLATKMPARKGGPGAAPAPASPAAGGRFVLPISECEFTVNAALDELQRNAFQTIPEHRPSRCTGTALQVLRQATPLLRSPRPCSSCIVHLLLLWS